MIGEIELRCGERPVVNPAYQFLEDLCHCGSASRFRQRILLRLNELADNRLIYDPNLNVDKYEQARQRLICEEADKLTRAQWEFWAKSHDKDDDKDDDELRQWVRDAKKQIKEMRQGLDREFTR